MTLTILDDRLHRRGRPVNYVPTRNQGGRMEPVAICAHDTADRLKPDDSVSWFKNPKSKVSAHLVLGRDGLFTQMVDFDRVAWHAGKSSWRGRPNCNAFLIGIEIDNPGPLTRKGNAGVAWYGEAFDIDEYGLREIETKQHGKALWMPYTQAQLDAFAEFVIAASVVYPSIIDVTAHYEISPGRKVDAGPQFPLADMRALVPRRKAPRSDAVIVAKQRLGELGYFAGILDDDVGARTRGAIRTFQEQNRLPMTGQFDGETILALGRSDAKSMPTAAREGTTKADMRAQGSETMAGASTVKRVTETLFGLQVAKAAVSPDPVPPAPPVDVGGSVLDKIGTGIAQAEQGRDIASRLSGLLDWVQTPDGFGTVLTLGLCALIWFKADKVELARLRDHILGRNSGG